MKRYEEYFFVVECIRFVLFVAAMYRVVTTHNKEKVILQLK